jgi:hypothetical protein
MATKIYDIDTVKLVDGTILELTPLKIKYLRKFMEVFELVKSSKNDEEAIMWLSECARITMEQYYSRPLTTVEFEDLISLPGIYKIIDVAAGIKIKQESEEAVTTQATEGGSTWDDLDLAKLESEVFLLGIWKDYNELETSLSMPELVTTLGAKRELDYEEKKFLAAMQGVDLDENREESNAWEDMKARVFSNRATSDSNDILSMQGINAQKAGFGIGMGLDYEKL